MRPGRGVAEASRRDCPDARATRWTMPRSSSAPGSGCGREAVRAAAGRGARRQRRLRPLHRRPGSPCSSCSIRSGQPAGTHRQGRRADRGAAPWGRPPHLGGDRDRREGRRGRRGLRSELRCTTTTRSRLSPEPGRSGCPYSEVRSCLYAGTQPAPPGLARRVDRLPGRAGGGRLRLLESAGPGRPRSWRPPWPASQRAPGGRSEPRCGWRCPCSLFMVAVNVLVSHRGDTVLVRGWDMPVLGNTDVTLESLAAGARSACGWSRSYSPSPSTRPAWTRTGCCALLRPVARRSAHDRRPGDPHGPVGGGRRRAPARGGRPARARRRAGRSGRPGAPAGRGLARPGGRRRRHARAARALAAGVRPRMRRERSRDDLPLYATGAALVLAAVAARIAGAGGFETYPRIEMSTATADARALRRWSCWPPFHSCAGARRCARQMEEVALAWLKPCCRRPRLSYRYPEAAADALRGVDLRVGARRVRRPRRALGLGQVDPAARRLRPGAALPRRRDRRRAGGRGLDVRSHGPAELAEAVGLVAQEPETQVVSTTVQAEIELPLELRGVSPAARARAVEEVSLALAIDGLLERTTDTLSGGELQRVALAAALVTRPRLVLLDEPTSQLDPVAGDELISLLRRLNEEWGVAVLLGRAPARALPGGGRSGARPGARAPSPSTAPQATSCRGRSSTIRVLATPGARLLDGVGLPAPASVREARRTLADRGVARASSRDARRAECRRGRGRIGRARLAQSLGRAGRGRGAHRGAAGRRTRARARRAGGPDGQQRRRQEHPAAGRGRPGRAGARQDRSAGAGSPCCPSGQSDLLRPRAGRRRAARARQGTEALRRFGLEGRTDADPRDLSGGERQRLALAIVVAGRDGGDGELPGALLLDEPTRGMDRAPEGRARRARRGELSRSRGGGDDRHPRRRVRRHVRRPGGPARRAARWPPTALPASCSPAAGTSRARWRASSTGRR